MTQLGILEQVAVQLEALSVTGEAVDMIGGGLDREEYHPLLVIQTSLAEWHIEQPDWRTPTWTATRYPGCGWHGPAGQYAVAVVEDTPASIAAGVKAVIDRIEGGRA